MTDETPITFTCANHPKRETVLRCNRCEKPICNECAIWTPTGYRCKECVRNQKKVFETAQSSDMIWGILIPLVLSVIGSFVSSIFGFFTLIIAPVIGVLIAEAVRWAVRRRRSTTLFRAVAISSAVGGLPLFLIMLLGMIFGLAGGASTRVVTTILPVVWQGLYIFLVASTAYYRLSGIELR
jgi:hypothetical protein